MRFRETPIYLEPKQLPPFSSSSEIELSSSDTLDKIQNIDIINSTIKENRKLNIVPKSIDVSNVQSSVLTDLPFFSPSRKRIKRELSIFQVY